MSDVKAGLHVGNNPDGSRIEVPFELLAIQRAHEIQGEIAAYVDSQLSPTDREGMAAMLQQVTLSIIMGNPPPSSNQAWALVALLGALQWAGGALALGAQVVGLCESCPAVDNLSDVVVDFSVLGPPPVVTAGQIAAALMAP